MGNKNVVTKKEPKIQVEKWRKEEKNKKDISSNNNNISNTGNTYNTNNTSNRRLPVLCITDISKVVFENNIFEQILRILATSNEGFTYNKIAEILKKKPDNVRQAISRKKHYFVIQKDFNGKVIARLSPLARDEIQSRINDLEQIEAQKIEEERKLKNMEIKEQEFNLEFKKFFHKRKLIRESHFVVINFNDIVEFSPKLAEYLLNEPNRFINKVKEYYDIKLNIKIINLPTSNSFNIEEIRKEHLNKILCIEGRVTSLGEVKPVIFEMTYECPSCGALITYKQNYRIGKLEEPKRCSCGRKGGFNPIKRKELNACFVQLEDLQEKTDNPHSQRIKGVLFNSLCEPNIIKLFTPGNEVKCSGVLKEVPVYKGNFKTVFLNWIFEIFDIELIEKEVEVEKFNEEEIKKINDLSEKINKEGIEFLYDSFAPEIYGYEEVKGAMILQACNKRNNIKEKTIRNKSNILMIGDPGIAKSVLGDFALKINTGSRKAVGGGSSAVGITASVVKEEDSLGGYRVEPGAMVLAKDLLFIDELNNLQDEDKPKLQEGMSEQIISINKANLHVQMKVSCGIIAAANPIYGCFKYDSKFTLQEQFNIPTPILNRFDSIFVMKDEINEEDDEKIAQKMINRQRGILNPKYNINFLKRFFAYIKYFKEPKINNDAQKILSKVYSLARKTHHSGVKINPRFLESLTRMSISSAKLRQSKLVELKDIKFAIKILSKTQYNVDKFIVTQIEKIK